MDFCEDGDTIPFVRLSKRSLVALPVAGGNVIHDIYRTTRIMECIKQEAGYEKAHDHQFVVQ